MDKDKLKFEQFITPDVLCEVLGISPNLLLRWRQRGMPFIKIGTKVFFFEPDVCEWMKKHSQTAGNGE